MRFLFELLVVASAVGFFLVVAGDRLDIDAVSQKIQDGWRTVQTLAPEPENDTATVAEPSSDADLALEEPPVGWLTETGRDDDDSTPVAVSSAGPPDDRADALPTPEEAYPPPPEPLARGEVSRILARLGKVIRIAARSRQPHPSPPTGSAEGRP